MVNRDEPTCEESLERRSKALFDASVDNLDGRTRSALNRARNAALAELERGERPLMWRVLGPVTGVAAAAFVVLVLFAPLRLTPSAVQGSMLPFEDLEIVAEPDDLEMLQNLEFYAWLDTVSPAQPCAGGDRTACRNDI